MPSSFTAMILNWILTMSCQSIKMQKGYKLCWCFFLLFVFFLNVSNAIIFLAREICFLASSNTEIKLFSKLHLPACFALENFVCEWFE